MSNEIELLAPAGKWEVLEAVAGAGADAVYLGGKRFNMRMLKPDFNFSDQELKDAADFLHQQGKKLYVTINNLYYESEIEQLADYLNYLQEIAVDALIIQDAALIKLHRQLGLTLPLHASVQMGTASAESIKLLRSWGIERAILSKNLSLAEIKSIYEATGMDLEYFAHGDLCVSHAGQCYMSSFACDQSGNRGLCVKPCRWSYQLEGMGYYEEPQYYLAHNDLCLFHCVKLLRDAGVVSFKLEGRMRGAEYLIHLVSNYRVALDSLKGSGSQEELDSAYKRLHERRIREFTAGNLFSRPGLDAIDPSGTREPIFVSTPFNFGRITVDHTENEIPAINQPCGLSVKIGSLEVVPELVETGVETLILGLEDMRQDTIPWTIEAIDKVIDMAAGSSTRVWVETPRVVTEEDMPELKKRLEALMDKDVDGVIVNDYGSLQLARNLGFSVRGSYGLNITNSMAAAFCRDNDLQRVTFSLELSLEKLIQALSNSAPDLEVMVQGTLCGMVSDLCVPRFSHGEEPGYCASYCMFDQYSLVDELGQSYRIRSDESCRNYIYYPYDLCLISHLPCLLAKGLRHMRIEGQFYSDELLLEVVRIYQELLDSINQGNRVIKEYYERLLALFPGGLCYNNAANQ